MRLRYNPAMLWAVLLLAAAPDGARIFATKCQHCHSSFSGVRAPAPAAMADMTRSAIVTSLESGAMKQQGATLSAEEREAVAAYLSAKTAVASERTNACPGSPPTLSALSGWNGWSASAGNTRYVAESINFTKLRLKWAFGHPGAASALGQPTVLDGVLLVGGERGEVRALDAATGCEYWRFRADALVRTAITVADGVAMFGDQRAQAYGISVADGKLRWKTSVDDHPVARLTGTPSRSGGRIYIPVSSHEEAAAAQPGYKCCSFRGSVVAIDIATGKIAWKTHLSKVPGAAVWLSPTIDAKRNVLYVGTGNAYGEARSEDSDSIIALDLATGERRWHVQLTPNDRWNMACVVPGEKKNCPPSPGEDFDFGASPLLVTGPDGKDRILAGQKSGIVHALDPDAGGKILWQTRVGKGGFLGGIEFGMAADSKAVYAPVSDWSPTERDSGGGLAALQITTGEKLWMAREVDPACATKKGCNNSWQAPASVAANTVFAGSSDGHLRAFDARTGRLLWDYDTARPFETVNGVAAKGGSLNGSGPVIAGRMLFVQSGYVVVNGMPGSALLAFTWD